MPRPTTTRRAVLAGLGTGFASGLTSTTVSAQTPGTGYALVQGDSCVPIQPLRGPAHVRVLYGYQLPERYVDDGNGAVVGTEAQWASAGTEALQRVQTSIAFLYRGPAGLSLVFVHGSVRNADAGSVTFSIAGLPADGTWLVRDDYYLDPETGAVAESNYDRWAVDGTDHRIDWTWGSAGTDGGVFGYLGDDFDVTVEPAFNEAAALYDQHYRGEVTDWEFLTPGANGPSRLPLALDEPIRVLTGRCADAGGPGPNSPQPGRPARPGRNGGDGDGEDDEQGTPDEQGSETGGRDDDRGPGTGDDDDEPGQGWDDDDEDGNDDGGEDGDDRDGENGDDVGEDDEGEEGGDGDDGEADDEDGDYGEREDEDD